MRPDDVYESWKRRRAEVDVPPGFANRVMRSLSERGATDGDLGLQGWIAGWLASPVGKVGICALAGLAFLLRVGSVIALFLEFAGKAEGAS
jgi:hypothetical protein